MKVVKIAHALRNEITKIYFKAAKNVKTWVWNFWKSCVDILQQCVPIRQDNVMLLAG